MGLIFTDSNRAMVKFSFCSCQLWFGLTLKPVRPGVWQAVEFISNGGWLTLGQSCSVYCEASRSTYVMVTSAQVSNCQLYLDRILDPAQAGGERESKRLTGITF